MAAPAAMARAFAAPAAICPGIGYPLPVFGKVDILKAVRL